MRNLFTTGIIALSLIFASCGSDEDSEPSVVPKIRIKVKNHPLEKIDASQPVSNAKVLLYNSKDFEKEPVYRGVTNEKGFVEFSKNLEFDKKYYVSVEKGCANNYNDLVYGTEGDFTVKAGNFKDIDLSTLDVSIRQTGKVILKNKSKNEYLIKLLNKSVATIAIGETLTFDKMPVNTSFYKLINVDTKKELVLNELAICGDIKEYTIE